MNQPLHFFVKKNSRLDFKDSYKKVYAFIEKRLSPLGSIVFYDTEESLSPHPIGLSVFIDCMNPLPDQSALIEAATFMQKNHIKELVPSGLIPGTQFDKILNTEEQCELSQTYAFDQQKIYNNQFNLYKFKRLKIFIRRIQPRSA